MITPDYEIKRPLDPRQQFAVGTLQARLARLVAAHTNSSLEIFSTIGLRANLVSRLAMRTALQAAPDIRHWPEQQLTDYLRMNMPETTTEPLTARVEGIVPQKYDGGYMLSLELSNETFEMEQDRLSYALDHLAGTDCHVPLSGDMVFAAMEPEGMRRTINLLENDLPATVGLQSLVYGLAYRRHRTLDQAS
jgi:hypothetical protein